MGALERSDQTILIPPDLIESQLAKEIGSDELMRREGEEGLDEDTEWKFGYVCRLLRCVRCWKSLVLKVRVFLL